MPTPKRTITFALATTAGATPQGPCADVPYVGVCIPVSEQLSPPTQHNLGEVTLPPDTSSGHQHRQLAPTDFANPLTSRILAWNTSGIAAGSSKSPPWQVPATIRPTARTPARSNRR